MTMTVGSNLRALRGRLGLSQRDVARRAGVAITTVWGVENGHKPRADTIYRIATALGVDVNELEPGPPILEPEP